MCLPLPQNCTQYYYHLLKLLVNTAATVIIVMILIIVIVIIKAEQTSGCPNVIIIPRNYYCYYYYYYYYYQILLLFIKCSLPKMKTLILMLKPIIYRGNYMSHKIQFDKIFFLFAAFSTQTCMKYFPQSHCMM